MLMGDEEHEIQVMTMGWRHKNIGCARRDKHRREAIASHTTALRPAIIEYES